MNKLETVQRLNDSAPQLEILQQLRELRQSLKDLPQMPGELARELGQQLMPLTDLAAKVRTLAVQFDQLNQRQRQTLDALTSEMVAKATASFSVEAAKLGQAIEAQTSAIKALDATANRAESAMKKLSKLPAQLDEAKLEMIDASETIRERIPGLWQMLMLATVAGLAAGLVAAGVVHFLASKPQAQRESVALHQLHRPSLASQRTSSQTRAQ